MKMSEIKDLNINELKIQLTDLEEEMNNLKFQHALRQLDNPLKLRAVRKDIARLKTVIKEHDLGLRKDKTQV